MIKFKKIPANVIEKIPGLSEKLREEKSIIALYLFGSSVKGQLKPLSDLDIAVLLDKKVPGDKFIEQYLKISGIATDMLKVEEIDLIILNEAPLRIVHNVLKTGNLLFCTDPVQLAGFIENNYKRYQDFMFYKNQYNADFRKRIGLLQ